MVPFADDRERAGLRSIFYAVLGMVLFVQLSLPAGSAVRASSWAWSKVMSAAVALAVGDFLCSFGADDHRGDRRAG